MSPWLIVVVAVLVAAYLLLRSWIRSTPRRDGPTADDREAIVAFERATARQGARLVQAAITRLQGELVRYGLDAQPHAPHLDSLRRAARAILPSWPSDPQHPTDAFLFVRASLTSRHPVLRIASDEGGFDAIERLASDSDASASDAARKAADAWLARMTEAQRRLSSTPESVWTSLTLIGIGLMGLEPDSSAERAVSAHVRRTLRDNAGSGEAEAAATTSLWMLSTTPAGDTTQTRKLPVDDAALAATVEQLLVQQASQGTRDQRARAVARGHWEQLWLAWEIVDALHDNAQASQAFSALLPIARRASRPGDGLDAELRSLAEAATLHVGPGCAERMVGVAKAVAAGRSQESVIADAPRP